jgi:hypothetical protein
MAQQDRNQRVSAGGWWLVSCRFSSFLAIKGWGAAITSVSARYWRAHHPLQTLALLQFEIARQHSDHDAHLRRSRISAAPNSITFWIRLDGSPGNVRPQIQSDSPVRSLAQCHGNQTLKWDHKTWDWCFFDPFFLAFFLRPRSPSRFDRNSHCL